MIKTIKKSIFINLFSFLIVTVVFGQKTDKIILIKGDTLSVKIVNISDTSLTYSLPNETITRTTEKKNINQIIFANGKKEIVTISKQSSKNLDWEKINFTTNPDDVKGLTKIGEIEGVGTSLMGGESKTRPKAEKEIKIKAAELGSQIIFIISQNFSKGAINKSTIIKGIAYKGLTNNKEANATTEVIQSKKKKTQNTDISSVNDWKKVTFTTNPDDVRGLKDYGEIEGVGKSLMGGEGKTRPKAEKEIKMKAAEKGAHIIFIMSQNFSEGAIKNSTIIKGKAYGK